jgi:hypothetical protein
MYSCVICITNISGLTVFVFVCYMHQHTSIPRKGVYAVQVTVLFTLVYAHLSGSIPGHYILRKQQIRLRAVTRATCIYQVYQGMLVLT